jgi:hypothetical protein
MTPAASFWVPALLVALALLDGALLGFRAAAGRIGLIDKQSHYRRAAGLGLGYAALVAAGGVALALGLRTVGGPPVWNDLVAAGAVTVRMLLIFAGVIVVSLLVWMVPHVELRTLATVVILGPGTLLRPAVVVLAMGAGVMARPRLEVALLAVYGGALMLLLQGFVTRRHYPVDLALLAGPRPGDADDDGKSDRAAAQRR